MVEKYYKKWKKLFKALIIGGESPDAYLKLLYWWRELERTIYNYYNWEGISRSLFRAFILVEGYNKGVEGSGEAYSEHLYRQRDIIRGEKISTERYYNKRI